MRGPGRTKGPSIPGVCLAVALLALATAPRLHAETKNFYFPEVRIEIAVARDGSFTVDESRTYEFRGPLFLGIALDPAAGGSEGARARRRPSTTSSSPMRTARR